jgi:hypothetical protein
LFKARDTAAGETSAALAISIIRGAIYFIIDDFLAICQSERRIF